MSLRGFVPDPVRATARRPHWADLPASARETITVRLGSEVISTTSTGNGFTPGFASRLDLADGRRVFVNAASAADDARSGWGCRGPTAKKSASCARCPPTCPLLRCCGLSTTTFAAMRWVILCFEYVDGAPPRRPWQPDELRLVIDGLAQLAPLVAEAPDGLELPLFSEEFPEVEAWVARVIGPEGSNRGLDEVAGLARESLARCADGAVADLDLRVFHGGDERAPAG